jgi:hypothetical protein
VFERLEAYCEVCAEGERRWYFKGLEFREIAAEKEGGGEEEERFGDAVEWDVASSDGNGWGVGYEEGGVDAMKGRWW